jgi:hypothetical protein
MPDESTKEMQMSKNASESSDEVVDNVKTGRPFAAPCVEYEARI